jgi:hypothetical protein
MNRRALTDSTIKPYCTHILTHLHTYLRTKLCLARLVASSKEFVVAVMNPFGDDVSAQWAPPSDRPLPRPCHRARASPSVAQPTVRFASLRFASLRFASARSFARSYYFVPLFFSYVRSLYLLISKTARLRGWRSIRRRIRRR